MKNSNKELKRMARENLSGHWRVPIFAYIETAILTTCLSMLTSESYYEGMSNTQLILFMVVTLLISLISMQFEAGFARIHLGLARGENVVSRMVFYGFRFHPMRYMGASLLTMLILLFPQIPYSAAIFYFDKVGANTLSISLLVAGSLVSLVAIIWVSLRLSQVYLILVDQDEVGPAKAVRMSWGLMRYRCWKLFGLYFSLIPLFLAAIISLGVGTIWLSPYVEQMDALFYLDLTNQL